MGVSIAAPVLTPKLPILKVSAANIYFLLSLCYTPLYYIMPFGGVSYKRHGLNSYSLEVSLDSYSLEVSLNSYSLEVSLNSYSFEVSLKSYSLEVSLNSYSKCH